MQFLIVLLLSVAAAVLRFRFGKVTPTLFGTYEAFAHILVGALIAFAIEWHQSPQFSPSAQPFFEKLAGNPFLILLMLLTGLEAVCFFA